MKYEILINSIFRLPLQNSVKLFEDYEKDVGFKNFAEQQKVLDILTHKTNVQKSIKQEVFKKAAFTLCMMAKNKNVLSQAAFENIKGFPMVVWIEAIGLLDANEIMSLLNNFYSELPSSLIETCIINLPENMQIRAIDNYNKSLDKNSDLFPTFYYSLSEKAKLKLKEYFRDVIEDDILLELQDLKEDEVVDKCVIEHERLSKLSPDALVEFILLKSNSLITLNKFLDLFKDKINNCTESKFKLLFTRYKYLGNYKIYGLDEEEEAELLSDIELFQLFKDKFHELGIEETLSLFNNMSHYQSNQFTVEVVSEFLDIAYADLNLSNYINNETILELLKRFVEKCSVKNYSKEDFEKLVNDIGKIGKTKLIFDDYIEAIIACGKLLKDNIISDKDNVFLDLRNKFTNDLIGRCEKDGTYLENISLNGIFYRLAKGSMPFDKVYLTKTYKGLIYLSKCGQLIDNADYITKFLTDELLAKLNITPVIKWKNIIKRSNTDADNLSFLERMGLQLLCYFGREKGKYLLDSNMKGNRMENLFDGLKYLEININEDGTPIINEELINYLFGKGIMKESNSVINRMIKGEIPEFEKYFTEFCNSFYKVKKACNGIFSVKRIVNYFEDVDLPIELKPDEIEFKQTLTEMNTLDSVLLNEAIQLCKDARNREFSSIPKVEGQIGDFTYKVLDLNDPMALTVGYLSHCCFVVNGISYSALKHSMQSPNGRTFVVYYKGHFLTQSWLWRNGDVICFDSVEAGSPYHGLYEDDIKLVDVYKRAAEQMLCASQILEDDIQKVKVVTVGKSDYTFNDLKLLEGDVPRPLEKDVYVYDSSIQFILAGSMPEEPRYGVVGAQYKDPRRKVVFINDFSETNIDTLDNIAIIINSLRYRINNEETPIDFTNYYKIILGDGWYILLNNDGSVENGVLSENAEALEEFKKYINKYTNDMSLTNSDPCIRKLKPSIDSKR